jgi:hypothetical protein
LPSSVSPAAREALRQPLSVAGVSLDLFTAPFKGMGREQVLVVGGQIGGDLRLTGETRLVMSYQLFAADGRLQTGEFQEFRLDLRPQTLRRVERGGLRFVERIALQPGRYELRMVIDQPGAAVGSVVAHVDVPDFDERLALSGLALAATSTVDHLTLREDDTFQKLFGSAPTALREFAVGERLGAFVEVYSNRPGLAAADVTLSAVLTTPDGATVARWAVVPVSAQLGTSDRGGRWPFLIALDLVDTPPGPYILTVDASARGVDRSVQRRIPIRIVSASPPDR